MYAVTNIQLFNQLKREGYSNSDFSCILKSYEFAVQMFTGRFQPSGNTFMAHVVRTASILGSLHVPAEVVAAGLIHSVYRNGDFRFEKIGVSDSKRQQVIRAVGKEVENYVYRYEMMRWTRNISTIRDNINTLNPNDKNVVLMNLANELEHHLDFEILYYYDLDKHRQYITLNGQAMVEIAEKLGFLKMAANLEKAFRETVFAEIPIEIRNLASRNRSFEVIRTMGRQESTIITPMSYSKRLDVVSVNGFRRLYSAIVLRYYRMRSAIYLGKKLLLKLLQTNY